MASTSTPTVALYARIPIALKERIAKLAEEGERAWPRLNQNAIIVAVLQLGLDTMATKTVAAATGQRLAVADDARRQSLERPAKRTGKRPAKRTGKKVRK